MKRHARLSLAAACGILLLSSVTIAQVTNADYERAQGLRDRYQYLATDVPDSATWVAGTNRFFYRK